MSEKEKTIEKEKGFLFEKKDMIFLFHQVMSFVIAIPALIVLYTTEFGEDIRMGNGYLISRELLTSMLTVALTSSIISLIKYYRKKNRKLLFYENKISKVISEERIVTISNVKEIYKSPYTGWTIDKLKRYTVFGKVLGLIFFPTKIILELLPPYITMLLFYKSFKFRHCLVLVGDTDQELISIDYYSESKEEQIKIEEYFQTYHNIDIKSLKTTWFIMKKEKE